MRLPTATDLLVDVAEDGTVRMGWGEGDWFGPGRPTRAASVGEPTAVADDLGGATEVTVVDDGNIRCSVRLYDDRPLVVFRTEALADVDSLATGAFDQPSVGWPVFTPSDRAAAAAHRRRNANRREMRRPTVRLRRRLKPSKRGLPRTGKRRGRMPIKWRNPRRS